MSAYKEIHKCRVSGSKNLITILDLGHQSLTGVFPARRSEREVVGPLKLVWCPDSGLVQLGHSYDPRELYGGKYGYRSGVNASMVEHLTSKVNFLERLITLNPGDVVVDIGSNDGTTLKGYQARGIRRIGIDPTASRFAQSYPPDIVAVPEFFSADTYRQIANEPATIVTSIAMFYDVESPVDFAREVASILADDGIWHFEQSYMPSMLRLNSYDTVCHEHLEYYSLGVVGKILELADLKLVDVVMNAINGGSFAVTAAKLDNGSVAENRAVIDWLLEQEDRMGLSTPRPFRDFEERVFRHREDLTRLILTLNADGKRVLGYGASTKGNVVLQFCGLGPEQIPAIADINPDKHGCFTPGTLIPIISEVEARAMKPDYFLVLPWHFKDGIVRREREYLARGGKLIFPFPEIEIL